MNEKTEQDNRDLDAWIAKQLEIQATHLFTKGLVDRKVKTALTWVLPFQLCIGRVVSSRNQAQSYWVISGDVPTDHVGSKLAASPRDAARHFALKWQLQSSRLESPQRPGDGGGTGEWSEAGRKLAQKAEALYAITLVDDNWKLKE